MAAPRVSAVINTLNEEQNLPHVLRSVRPWVDEMIVVDMHSEDRTVEVARELGANVYLHPRMGYVEPARAFAVGRATGDWIVLLDADEMIPHPLSSALLEIARADRADVAMLPRLNYMLGAQMMHTRCGPQQDYQLRFFKPGFLNLTDQIHRGARPTKDARVVYLPYGPGQAIVHFANVDFAQILEKINLYTTIEAGERSNEQKRPRALRSLARGGQKFCDYYIKAKGYRDGWRGFCVSAANLLYVLLVDAKVAESRANGPRGAVEAAYRSEAEKIISEYDMAPSPTPK
jgi:glycosyltransferase involved in cell wall biosynthesis